MSYVYRYIMAAFTLWPTQILLSIGMVFLLLFQNCGQPYRSKEILSNSSLGLSAHISHDAGPTAQTNQVIRFTLTGCGLTSATTVWSYALDGSNSGCQTSNLVNANEMTISCSTAGQLEVRTRVTVSGQVFIAESNVPVVLNGGGTGGQTGVRVDFRIPSGTGMTGNWNTAQSPIVVFIGQTLRIINEDSIAHAIHTGGAPFPHGQDIAAGAMVDYPVVAVYNSDASPAGMGPLYDHLYQNQNPRPNIYVYSLDGAALYASNCASCHSPLATSTKRGRTVQQISAAIGSVPDMAGLSSLTDRQRAALAFALRLGSN